MQRPLSIVWFERCYLGGVALGLVNTALAWNGTMAKLAENPATTQFGPSFGPSVLLATAFLGLLISIVLWYFTARKGSVVTKWIITVFFVIGLLALLGSAAKGTFPTGIAGVLTVAVWVLDAIAVFQLFKPDTKPWFGETAA